MKNIKKRGGKSQKDHLYTSINLNHNSALSVACISVIRVISASQCRLNKGRFHGSVDLFFKK